MTTYGGALGRHEPRFGRLADGLLLFIVLDLTAATAFIHLSLGGALFTLNGLGYLALGAAYLASAVLPVPLVRRLSWMPRAGLAAFAFVTIAAYLLMGPYFLLGWTAKGIELAIIGVVAIDLLRRSA